MLLAGCGGGGSGTAPGDPTTVEGPDLATQQKAIEDAIDDAEAAVKKVNDDADNATVAAAEKAIADARKAIADAADVSAREKAANTRTVDALGNRLADAKMARQTAMSAEADADSKARAALGTAMYAALAGPNETDNALANTNTDTTVLTANGLTITAADNAGSNTAAVAPVTFEAGESVGPNGSWAGTAYADTEGTGDDRVTTEARVYTNKGAPTERPFAEVHTAVDANGVLPATQVTEGIALVMADAFNHQGTQTHAVPSRTNGVYVRGTFDGAPGEFFCASGCSSTNDGSGSPSGLVGGWTFTPDKGAMVHQADANYL
ncbi:MAG: hypothetical protein OXC29_09120, partial [Rhodococcus sp.]|nr:hypothetical protein [Rhodococcus sp. (in: high G+C Gram-positive bacteria)]